MKTRLLLLACCVVVVGGLSRSDAQNTSIQTRLSGKWIPPSGPAGGKEFEVIGWVSSAPPRDKAHNVITISFSVSLTTYGSITSYTGYFKDNKITASWFNIKPNSAYEWDHISTGQDIFTKN